LDVQWRDGKLADVTVRSRAGGACRLRYGAVTRDLNLAKGQSAQWDGVK
jgi:alpha-L-fucosidase 2